MQAASDSTISLDPSDNSAQQKIVFLSDSEIGEDCPATKESNSNAAAAAISTVSITTGASAVASSVSMVVPGDDSSSTIQTYKLMPIKICLSESDEDGEQHGGGGGRSETAAGGSYSHFCSDSELRRRSLRTSDPNKTEPNHSSQSEFYFGLSRRSINGNGRTRRQWSQENMLKAYNAVVNLGLPLRLAATKFKVPESTLRDRLHGRVNINCTRPGPQTFFTAGEEHRIVDHILFLHRIGYTVLRKHITETANHLLRLTSRATRLSIGESGDTITDEFDDVKDPLLMNSSSHDFVSLASAMETQTWLSEQSTSRRAPASVTMPQLNKRQVSSLPSASWLYSFTHRWPKIKECVSMSSHHRRYVIEDEVTDANRITYLRALTKVMLKHKISSDLSRYWMMDEASMSCTTHPPRLMNCQTQRLQMPYQSEFPHVTIVGAGNAVGDSVPPFLLYRGAQVYKEMVLGATKGTKFTYSETGYLSPEIFMSWLLRHFVEYAGCSPDNPTLLFYDGHLLYVTISVLEEARRKGVILFPLPPHAGDLGICASFSALNKFRYHFSKSMNLQMCRAPTDKVSNLTICPFICSAYNKAVGPAYLKEVWRTTGLEDLVAQIMPELPQSFTVPSQQQQQQQQLSPTSSEPDPLSIEISNQHRQKPQQQSQPPPASSKQQMPRFKVEPPNEVFENVWDEIATLAEHSLLTASAEAAAAASGSNEEKENQQEDDSAASSPPLELSSASPPLPPPPVTTAATKATSKSTFESVVELPSAPPSSSSAASSTASSESSVQPATAAGSADPLTLAMAAAEAITFVDIHAAIADDDSDTFCLTDEADMVIDELKRQLAQIDKRLRVVVKSASRKRDAATNADSLNSPAEKVARLSSSSTSSPPPAELLSSSSSAGSEQQQQQQQPGQSVEPPPASSCIVCGCLAPPTCLLVSRASGKPVVTVPPYTVIEWAQCDYCSGWLHLRTCSDDRVVQDNLGFFKCTVCRGQELQSVCRSHRSSGASCLAASY